MELAQKVKAPVAFLYGIPNQPLFDGKTEDALIAETFVRYLETKDETGRCCSRWSRAWSKAMDALQAFAKQEWKHRGEGFVVTGGSKRGWTTWLTGRRRPARQGDRADGDRHAEHAGADAAPAQSRSAGTAR